MYAIIFILRLRAMITFPNDVDITEDVTFW